MMRAGWEKVWPLLRPSSTSNRYLNITSSLTGKDALLEHGPDLEREPITERRSTVNVGDQLDAKSDFCQGDTADERGVKL